MSLPLPLHEAIGLARYPRRRLGWMVVGGVMVVVGACWFAVELGQRAMLANVVGATRGDMPAFEPGEYTDSGGLGFLLMLLGLVPIVAGALGGHGERCMARIRLALELRATAAPIEAPPLDAGSMPAPARARLSGREWVSLAIALGVAVVVAVGSMLTPAREPSPPEHLLREMGLPVAYYRREAQGPIHAKPGRQLGLSEVSEPRGVGVALVLAVYGPPDEVEIEVLEFDEVTGEPLPKPPVASAPPRLRLHGMTAGIDRHAVRSTITRRLPGMQACVDQTGHFGRAGGVTITIELSAAGRVTRVEIDEDAFDDAALRRCLTARIARWRFVEHASPQSAMVTFSVRFG